MGRSRSGGNERHQYIVYKCNTASIVEGSQCLKRLNEKYVFQAVGDALRYQIQLAADYQTKYGMDFYRKLEKESSQVIKKSKDAYEKYGGKLEQLFEHYATGIIDREEYMEFKETYLLEQEQAHRKL